MQKTENRVSVIVLNYNGGKYVGKCLRGLYQSTHSPLDIVFVDNASTDGSLEEIKKDFSAAHIIRSDYNRGFAGGMNLGIRFALEKFSPDFILLLNSDAVVGPETISQLAAELKADEKLGLISPQISQSSGKPWFLGGRINWLRMRCEHERRAPKNNFSSFLSGCALLIRKEVFRDAGLLDERFFLYYEDADFCLRAQKKGYALKVSPTAKVLHSEESEKDKVSKTYWLVLSGCIFFAKNTSYPLRFFFPLILALRKFKNRLKLLFFPRDEIAKSVSKAYADYESSKAIS
ncbi:MAG TPA: glycosyltransferase family 2 protein [Candidatus Moranbacteria bacterium]|nr:glycosyltransferase family 2 protein [Candidatus Moranbacteria bacterium]